MKNIILLLTISYFGLNQELVARTSTNKPIITHKKLQKATLQIHQELLKELATNQKDCDLLRQKMDILIDYLDFDRIFILGKNDKYYREGMHKAFYKAPEPLKIGPNINRNPLAAQLELTHIDLYYCDKGLYSRIARFGEFMAGNSVEKMQALQVNLNERFRRLSIKEQRRLKRQKYQQNWLQTQLLEILQLKTIIEERALLSQPLASMLPAENVIEKQALPIVRLTKIATKENANIQVHIFPNPNHGTFTFQTTSDWSNKAVVEILDIMGNIRLSKPLKLDAVRQIYLQLPNAEAGIYFVRLVDNRGQWQQMLIVQ